MSLRLGLLVGKEKGLPPGPDGWRDFVSKTRVSAVFFHADLLTAEIVRELRSRLLEAGVWGIKDDARLMLRAIALGPDSITTDAPDILRDLLRKK